MALKDNFYKPTPVKFRKIGDAILYFCTSALTLVAAADLPSGTKVIIMLCLGIGGVLGKTITNFFTEDNTDLLTGKEGDEPGKP